MARNRDTQPWVWRWNDHAAYVWRDGNGWRVCLDHVWLPGWFASRLDVRNAVRQACRG